MTYGDAAISALIKIRDIAGTAHSSKECTAGVCHLCQIRSWAEAGMSVQTWEAAVKYASQGNDK